MLNDPVSFIVCYTPGGSGQGGTGQALRVARAYNIPVTDLGFYTHCADSGTGVLHALLEQYASL
jgi:hypothetical protein